MQDALVHSTGLTDMNEPSAKGGLCKTIVFTMPPFPHKSLACTPLKDHMYRANDVQSSDFHIGKNQHRLIGSGNSQSPLGQYIQLPPHSSK